MRLRELWRTTTFRLTLLYGLVFALGTVALLGMVYLQSAVYLTHRVDSILRTEADALAHSPPGAVAQRIQDDLALNGDQTNIFALFTSRGDRIAGDLMAMPAGLRPGGPPMEVPPTATFPAHARLMATQLPSGRILVVGRDVNQLREMRQIISSALFWSGLSIILVGLACGIALSIRPLSRLRLLRVAADDIAAGDLARRMPISNRHDELDMFAGTVNYMMDEVERLMTEVKGVTETIAHDLRTPLTRVRAQLHRVEQAGGADAEQLARMTAELDEVLERFRALLRISELESWKRRDGFARVDPIEIIAQVVDLYQPLAEASGVGLSKAGAPGQMVEADAKLLFEAVSNLVDNAIKFSGDGGRVVVRLAEDAGRPQIIVQDDGPGIAPGERSAVLQRFYRTESARLEPGSGLGLSVVAAIVRLHRFELLMEDAEPGLRTVIECRAPALGY